MASTLHPIVGYFPCDGAGRAGGTVRVNGGGFLYGASMGMYHRGPLSPRWNNIIQKHKFSPRTPPAPAPARLLYLPHASAAAAAARGAAFLKS